MAPNGENSAACTMAFGSFFLVSTVLRSASWIFPSVAPIVSSVASSGVTSSVITATVCGLPSRSCSIFWPAARTRMFSRIVRDVALTGGSAAERPASDQHIHHRARRHETGNSHHFVYGNGNRAHAFGNRRCKTRPRFLGGQLALEHRLIRGQRSDHRTVHAFLDSREHSRHLLVRRPLNDFQI